MHDPRVPETLEGWSLLHQMFRVRWSEWLALARRRAAGAGRARRPARCRPCTDGEAGATALRRRCSATRAT